MKVLYGVVVLQTLFSAAISGGVEDTKAKAIIVEADEASTPKAKAATQTRLFTSDPTINSAIAGVGIGVVGSLLVGALLDSKNNKCNPRGRRDTASTRFLPGLTGKQKCPPVGYPAPYQHTGYPAPNTGYAQPNQGYAQPNQGYAQPNQGYPAPYSNNGYPRPNQAYQQPYAQQGYQQPIPSSGYQQPIPASGYHHHPVHPSAYQPAPVYHKPTPSYPQPTPSYTNPTPVYSNSNYRPPSSNYRPSGSSYQPNSNSGYKPNFSASSNPPSPSYQNQGYNNGGYRAPGRSLKSGSSSGKSSGPVEFSAGIRALPGATSKA